MTGKKFKDQNDATKNDGTKVKGLKRWYKNLVINTLGLKIKD